MDSSKQTKMSNSGALYTPPRVVRISELKQGGGILTICETGSGAGGCGLGQQANVVCSMGNEGPTKTF